MPEHASPPSTRFWVCNQLLPQGDKILRAAPEGHPHGIALIRGKQEIILSFPTRSTLDPLFESLVSKGMGAHGGKEMARRGLR